MVHIRINSQCKQFLLDYQQQFQTEYFNRKMQTDELECLWNQYIQLSRLRQYVQRWNSIDKQQFKVRDLFKPDDIIQQIEFKQLETEAGLTKEERESREDLLNRAKERRYQSTVKGQHTESVKDIEKSISFGVSFIFTLFLSGLSGFYFGKHIMGVPDVISLILALIFTIFTMTMEILLFIIKTTKKDTIKKQVNIQDKPNKVHLKKE